MTQRDRPYFMQWRPNGVNVRICVLMCVRRLLAYLFAELYVHNGCGDHQFGFVIQIMGNSES